MRLSEPKGLLHAEGLAVLAAATFVYSTLGASWWWYALLFLAPDLAMLGYLRGQRIGAWSYNVAHTYVGPLLLAAGGYFAESTHVLALALIWSAHIGFDRLLGYGLKYPSGFKITHLHRV